MVLERIVAGCVVTITVMTLSILVLTSVTLNECKQIKGNGLSSSSYSEDDINIGSAEWFDIQDKVLKYRQSSHNWNPTITKIQTITNMKLKQEQLKASTQLYGPHYSTLKFHGTGRDAGDSIIKDGFVLPKKAGMFGAGVYFATDASKSAQYTKGSNRLLLCDVLLGRSLIATKADRLMSEKKLDTERCDSVFARRGMGSNGGVQYDEFVVFNPSQALPKYIIYYTV